MPIKITKATPASAANISMGYSSSRSASIRFPYINIVFSLAQLRAFCALILFLSAGCMSTQTTRQISRPVVTPTVNKILPAGVANFYPVSWEQIPGWENDSLDQAWGAWLNSCQALLKSKDASFWRAVCLKANQLNQPASQSVRDYFQKNFQVLEIRHAQSSNQFSAGSEIGLVTGYYVPEIKGSLYRTEKYQAPLHAYPEVWSKAKPRSLPTRAELLSSGILKGRELVWVEDPVLAAFVQIQGSGIIRLDDGGIVQLGFSGTNEHPFKPLGQWLIQKGEMKASQASMQSIQAWARKNPERVDQLLNSNPRYVFFKKMPSKSITKGPIGSIGVPLTAGRSIAVDWKAIPQGAPVFLSTTYPNSNQLLQRLVLAQDTGSAIVGAVRADFYWGSGDVAGENAGKMKQSAKMWLLLPLPI